jgi:hypothetical protein
VAALLCVVRKILNFKNLDKEFAGAAARLALMNTGFNSYHFWFQLLLFSSRLFSHSQFQTSVDEYIRNISTSQLSTYSMGNLSDEAKRGSQHVVVNTEPFLYGHSSARGDSQSTARVSSGRAVKKPG